jgi:hypothetical protein
LVNKKAQVVLSPHCQVSDLLPIGCLIIVGNQSYHRRVICKLDDGVGVMRGYLVVGEQGVQERTKHTTLRDPRVDGQHGTCVVANLTTWGALSPRVLSLEWTMVLN